MTSVSIDNTIAKILRDTRLPDTSYLADMYEWIPEAMRMLKTMVEMPVTSKTITIHNYMGNFPCGLVDLLAVKYAGSRLRYYTGILPGGSLRTVQSTDTVFEAFPTITSQESGDIVDISYVMSLPDNSSEGYQVAMDHIYTTFREGQITIYYKAAPTDERGLPLVPDHADYKEAIYWFVRSKIIQTGYTDPVYGLDDRIPFERFEMYAARAISDIIYPSVDQKEAQLAMSVRFIPPVDYWSSFFNTELKEPIYLENSSSSSGFSSPIGPLNNSANL